MKAFPKTPPIVVLELSAAEAAALVRAVGRALQPVRQAGNSLDAQRFEALLSTLGAALRGRTHETEDMEVLP